MIPILLWQVEKVVYADVPSLPFADANSAYEKKIMTGQLRTMDTIVDVNGSIADDGIERAEVLFEAQKGDLIDYMDTRKSRRESLTIMTWKALC